MNLLKSTWATGAMPGGIISFHTKKERQGLGQLTHGGTWVTTVCLKSGIDLETRVSQQRLDSDEGKGGGIPVPQAAGWC